MSKSDSAIVRASGFYQTKKWKNISYQIKLRDQSICQICQKAILGRYVCDHIIELTPRNMHIEAIAYDPENLRTVHLECHSRRHLQERHNSNDFISGTEVDFEQRDSQDPFHAIMQKYG